MRRVTTYRDVPIAPPHYAGEVLPRRSELGDKVLAAGFLGIGTACLCALAFVVAGVLLELPLLTIVVLVGVAVAIGLGTWAWFTVTWSYTVAKREWVIEDGERCRRWGVEDEERDHLWRQREGVGQHEDDGGSEEVARVHQVARALLERHYDGRPISRSACVKDGICTQVEWNAVNVLMRILGWKRARTLDVPAPGLDEAWVLWQESVEPDGRDRRKLWVCSKDGACKAVYV